MKIGSVKYLTGTRPEAFTLPELMVATSVGIVLVGAVVMLLIQAALENRRALATTTTEIKTFVLQSTISACLRVMSANQGISPNYSTALADGNGNVLGYQTIYVFQSNTNGTYSTKQISFDSNLGKVTYTPDMTHPGNQIVWMTNSPVATLRKLCFSNSLNPDGSLNGSLINVRLQMDDNGFSRQASVNNSANIYRFFSVKMRSD